MKKIFIPVLICASLAACYILYSKVLSSGGKTSETASKIQEFSQKYKEKFFASVFSLNEFRSYSIARLNSTVEKYENKWISPVSFAEALTQEEKDTIIGNTVEMIELAYKNRKNDVIDKIRFWCLADNHFDFINSGLEIDRMKVMKAISETNNEMHFTDANVFLNDGATGVEPELDFEKTYYATLNMIASWPFDNQMKYYSKIYYHLAGIR